MDQIVAVSIFPDNQKVVSLNQNGIINIWDIAKGSEISRWSHTKSTSDVIPEKQSGENLVVAQKDPITWGLSSVTVSPDGKRILSGGGDTYMRLWTLEGDEICEYPHNTRVAKVAFLPDGYHALSGCWDGSVYLWDLPQ